MPEQPLDYLQVSALLKQMGGKSMAKAMNTDWFGDARSNCGTLYEFRYRGR
jgi:hypothetical protein